ncbi:hypothetical protein BJ508DRAFT_303012 [Ascobolus immersus RN42]|uniref:MYND-type domain-containing protein n=1 Tax=Ascobolus immersus RN42 TaxID=1160509 RepID=A0A3N4IIU4_ASCIM|nr:hypothetical protein BJ508DRAFT_303012 [Ascobolus immersus RN42]
MPNCKVCEKSNNLMKCGRCNDVFYCSRECQKTDWKKHKVDCKPTEASRMPSNVKTASIKGANTRSANTFPILDTTNTITVPLSSLRPVNKPIRIRNIAIPTHPEGHPDRTMRIITPKDPEWVEHIDRRIFLDNISVIHNQTSTPLNHPMRTGSNSRMVLILFHGIIGDPNRKKDSELFRLQLLIPQHDLDILRRIAPSTERDREMVYQALYNRTIFPAVFPRCDRVCLGCGSKAKTGGHNSKFRIGKSREEGAVYTNLDSVWSLIGPVCGKAACELKGREAIAKFEKNHDKEMQELEASYCKGCLPTWRKEGMNRPEGTGEVIWG